MTSETSQPKLGEYFDIESVFRRAHLTSNPIAWLVDASGSGKNHFAIGYESVDFLPEPLGKSVTIENGLRFYGFITYEGIPSWFQALSWLETDSEGVVTAITGDWDFITDLPAELLESPFEFRSAEDSEVNGKWRHNQDEYLSLVEQCIDEFSKSRVTQLCLTNKWSSRANFNEVETWLRLLSSSTSPYCGYFRVAGQVLISASPECFISIADGHIKTSPIKGTRPRSEDPVLDEKMKQELSASPKEQEENSTIAQAVVDEISRVCIPGTSKLTESLVVRSFAQVHQLISTIEGELDPDASLVKILSECFPAGSMTGFPKTEAIEILKSLEGGNRGIYSGCFGFVEPGRVELGMVIRSLVVSNEKLSIGAGGGLTSKSIPEDEVAEAWFKARVLLESIAWTP